MAMSRTTTIVLAFCSAMLLVGCSDANPTSDAGSAGPTPTPGAVVVWADSVCAASTDLRASVQGAGAALDTGLAGSATSLEQAKAEVRGHVEAVQQSATALAQALSGVPVGADQQSAVRDKLQTASLGAQAAVDQVRAAAGQVADAQAAAELVAALAMLKSAVTDTAAALKTYLESLQGTVGAGEQAARDSFGAAYACQELTASP